MARVEPTVNERYGGEQMVEAASAADRPVPIDLVRLYHRQRIRWRTWRACGRRYTAPIEPFGVLEVEPEAITDDLDRSTRRSLETATPPHVQHVADGGWDLEGRPVLETDWYQAVREAVGAGATVDVERPGVPAERSTAVADGGDDHDRDQRALEWYLADVVARGYRSIAARRAVRSSPQPAPSLADPYPTLPPPKGEVRVNVGRDGRLLLHSGRIRVAVARLLRLTSIPVHVYVRHERWQRRRDRLVLTGAAGSTREHPDLEGL